MAMPFQNIRKNNELYLHVMFMKQSVASYRITADRYAPLGTPYERAGIRMFTVLMKMIAYLTLVASLSILGCEQNTSNKVAASDRQNGALVESSFKNSVSAPKHEKKKLSAERKYETPMELGTVLPNLRAETFKDESTTSEDLFFQGKNLVMFYKAGACVYCNKYVHDLASEYAKLKAEGIHLILMNTEKVSDYEFEHATYDIPFTVLKYNENWLESFQIDAEGSDAQAVSGLFALNAGQKVLLNQNDAQKNGRPTIGKLLEVSKRVNW